METKEVQVERKIVEKAVEETHGSAQQGTPDIDKIANAKSLWNNNNQGHVFQFVEDLNSEEKKTFYNQLDEIDVSKLKEFRQHALDTDAEMKDSMSANYSSIPGVSIASSSDSDKKRWEENGMRLISEGKVAVLVLAGGQGSRLGSSDPKGMYDIKLPSHKSLFQFQGEKISRLQSLVAKRFSKDSVIIPWYVMTSPATHTQTEGFFVKHNYFGLKKENILFFQQGVLPAMTPEGKVVMESKSKVFVAPDGNGGLYRALKDKGILEDMNKRGIKWISQYCVDNILSKLADPTFIGYSAEVNANVTCKSVKKVDPEEKVGLLVMKNNKPTVVEYSEIPIELMKKKDDNGELFLRAGHICINCFSISFLEKAASEYKTKFHIAKKKIPTIDEKGNLFNPTKENGWKLEQFIFDPFEYSPNVFVFEVPREQEFSALKNPPGTKSDSPDSARQDLSNLHKSWVKNSGGSFKDGEGEPLLEISPLLSYDGEDLEVVKGKEYQLPTYIQ